MNVLRTILGLALVGALCPACSDAKSGLDELADGGNTGQTTFSVKGKFQSDCMPYPLGGMRTVDLESDGDQVTITKTFYNGNDCTTENSKETLEGTLEDHGASGEGTLVKMVIPIDANISTWKFYKIKKGADKLMMSEEIFDENEASDIPMNIELLKVDN